MDLSVFCDPSREYTATPFSVGDYSYATTGYLIVRIDRDAQYPENDSAPDISRLQWDHERVGLWAGPPAVLDVKPDTCKCCSGTGKLSVCPECNGEGEVEPETDFNTYECECATCCGSGSVKGSSHLCKNCFGSGEDSETRVPWRAGTITLRALKLASALPGLKFSTHGEAEEIIRIKFDGGVGLLMPARQRD